VVRADTVAVLAFLRDLRSGAAPCHLVKVVLLSDQRAGKSSLADSMVRGRPATRPADDRTVGIEVRRWPLGAGPKRAEEEEEAEEVNEDDEDEEGFRRRMSAPSPAGSAVSPEQHSRSWRMGALIPSGSAVSPEQQDRFSVSRRVSAPISSGSAVSPEQPHRSSFSRRVSAPSPAGSAFSMEQ
jgi:hypothetical protein